VCVIWKSVGASRTESDERHRPVDPKT